VASTSVREVGVDMVLSSAYRPCRRGEDEDDDLLCLFEAVRGRLAPDGLPSWAGLVGLRPPSHYLFFCFVYFSILLLDFFFWILMWVSTLFCKISI
jgi:hypothetical protein